METARCRAFVEAARCGSFTGAAEKLGYTTSAVSQLITALEEDLGITLFHRSRKGVSLTADGERMHTVLYNFVRQEDQIYQSAEQIRGVLVGEIVIAAYPSICAAWLPGIIRGFQAQHPGVSIRIDDSIRRYVLESLGSGRADVGFLSDQHDFAGEWIELERNPMVAVVGRSSRYAGLSAFPVSECERAPLIQPSHGQDKDLIAIFDKYHLHPNIAYITRNSSTAAARAQDDMGVLLVNELSTRMWHFDVEVLPLDPPQFVSLGMAVSTLAGASPAVKAFVRFVREWFREKSAEEAALS